MLTQILCVRCASGGGCGPVVHGVVLGLPIRSLSLLNRLRFEIVKHYL